MQPERIKRDEAVQAIRALAPDVIVVMAYGQILPRAILDIPPIACLNLHASLLPKHRGAAPIQAAILAGDTETGITVMYMDEGLDTGDILLKRHLQMTPDETGGSLHDKLAEISPGCVRGIFTSAAKRKCPSRPAGSGCGDHAPKLEREHGLIDWSEPAEAIARKIRAFNPWPGAYMLLRDDVGRERKLKIHRAALESGGAAEGIRVSARDGVLLLLEVQLEGKKRMPAAEFIWLPGRYFQADQAHQAAALLVKIKPVQCLQHMTKPLPGKRPGLVSKGKYFLFEQSVGQEQHLLHELFLAGEVVVEAAFLHPASLGNIVHGSLVIPLLPEHLIGLLDDELLA